MKFEGNIVGEDRFGTIFLIESGEEIKTDPVAMLSDRRDALVKAAESIRAGVAQKLGKIEEFKRQVEDMETRALECEQTAMSYQAAMEALK